MGNLGLATSSCFRPAFSGLFLSSPHIVVAGHLGSKTAETERGNGCVYVLEKGTGINSYGGYGRCKCQVPTNNAWWGDEGFQVGPPRSVFMSLQKRPYSLALVSLLVIIRRGSCGTQSFEAFRAFGWLLILCLRIFIWLRQRQLESWLP